MGIDVNCNASLTSVLGGKSQITDNVLQLQPFEQKREPKVNRLIGPFGISPCRYAKPVNGVHKINGKSV